jgi:hypothetical protein
VDEKNSTACRLWLPADPAALGDQFTTAPATKSSGEYNLYLKFDRRLGDNTDESFGGGGRSTRFYGHHFAFNSKPNIQSKIDNKL